MCPRSEESPSEISIRAGIGTNWCTASARRCVRFGAQVPAGKQASAQWASDQDYARLGPRAADGAASTRFPEHGDADDQRAVPGVGVAADQVDAKPLRQFPHADIKTLSQSDGVHSWQSDGHNGGTRNARHGRDVGQVHGQRLVADGPRAVLGKLEMSAVHQHVGRYQEVGARTGTQDRAIVADSENGAQARLRTLALADPVDQGEFAELRSCHLISV